MKPVSVLRLCLLFVLAGCSREVEQTASNVVALSILGDGTYVWNGERIADAETLDRYWKAVSAQDPQPEIHLQPSAEAAYESVRRALEGAQKNGVTKLGFVGNERQ